MIQCFAKKILQLPYKKDWPK